MQVRCVRIISTEGEELQHHPSVTVGEVYDVVAIQCVPECETSVLIYCEADKGPSWWSIHMFTVESPEIPANWTISIGSDGELHIGLPQVRVPGFLEHLYMGDDEAKRTFEEVFLRFRSS